MLFDNSSFALQSYLFYIWAHHNYPILYISRQNALTLHTKAYHCHRKYIVSTLYPGIGMEMRNLCCLL